MQWEQNAPQHMQTSSWIYLRKHIYPLMKQKVQFYHRYADDIFFIWTGSGNGLQEFISKISEVHLSIKFDFKTQIYFLVITIAKTSTGKLSTALYKKEIDRQFYLH